MKIYTKTGDKGQTSLYDGSRIDKDSLRVEAYGTLDELNSYIGLSANYVKEEDKNVLLEIQKYLFVVSAELATKDDNMIKRKVTEEDVNKLECIIDEYINKTSDVNAFIVPGTSLASANLHIARTICRRAERRILSLSRGENISSVLAKYINRLSDTLYSIARYYEEELILIDF